MAKKQVGILTFSYIINPGSLWQAFGLWDTINRLSPEIECHIINYHSRTVRNVYLKFPSNYSIKGFALWIIQLVWFTRYQCFWKGKGMKSAVRPKCKINEKNLRCLNEYDTIVVGSDQVWNTKFTKKDYNYFLPFISGVKKVSYAASIGLRDFPEDDKKSIEGLLKDFSCISVREPEAQNAIENLIGQRPQLMIDPSLLLSKQYYEHIAAKPVINKKYILLYLIHGDDIFVKQAQKMAEELGLQLVECRSSIKKISGNNSIIFRNPSPKKWVSLIKNAEYVFTDSFHGCAFCINLTKPFYVMISSANSEMSSRIYNILEKYQMTDRMITDQSDLMAMREMSFEYSNKMLEQDRQDAIAYLKSALDLNE